MSRQRKHIPIEKSYAVIVDGETEQWYLQMLRKNEPSLNIAIEPKIHVKQSLDAQFQEVKDACATHDKVFWMLDLDTILKESKTGKKGFAPLNQLENYLNAETGNDKLFTIINVPCLEFWFLLHYKYTSRFYKDFDELKSDLKKHLRDYEKNKDYFVKGPKDIYVRLKGMLKTAIDNSQKLGNFKFDNPERGISEFFKLFEEIQIPQ